MGKIISNISFHVSNKNVWRCEMQAEMRNLEQFPLFFKENFGNIVT
jgi:hypothetical protein